MTPFTEEQAFQTRRRFLAALGSDEGKFIGNDEADPTSTVYHLHNHKSAQALAKRMAHDRRLELIDDASPA